MTSCLEIVQYMAVSRGGGNSKPIRGDPSNPFIERVPMNTITPEEPQCSSRNWYFSREEIEKQSPSRKDGIDVKRESQLRRLYCLFLHELGIKLKVPQVTIAAAMILCHRFYLRQSHTRNDWQTIATVSMFMACKVEETPRLLRDLVVVSYELIYKRDPSAPRRIRLKEVYEQQKELILIGERLLLATIAFDVDIQLPYKPLVAALKNLGLNPELSKIAWNFVNDWLCTTLCLQYKPHYIAAGCVYLAAKFQNVKLPTSNGKVWWMEFDIIPRKLEEVIRQMLSSLGRDRKQTLAPKEKTPNYTAPVATQALNSSQQSCVTSVSSPSIVEDKNDAIGTHESKVPDCSDNRKCTLSSSIDNVGLTCQTSGATSGCGISAVKEDNSIVQPKIEQGQNLSTKSKFITGIDVSRIRELRRKKRGVPSNNLVENMNFEIGSEAWVEREIEMGIQTEDFSFAKKQRKEYVSILSC